MRLLVLAIGILLFGVILTLSGAMLECRDSIPIESALSYYVGAHDAIYMGGKYPRLQLFPQHPKFPLAREATTDSTIIYNQETGEFSITYKSKQYLRKGECCPQGPPI